MRGPPTDMEGRKEAEALMWLLGRGRKVGDVNFCSDFQLFLCISLTVRGSCDHDQQNLLVTGSLRVGGQPESGPAWPLFPHPLSRVF